MGATYIWKFTVEIGDDANINDFVIKVENDDTFRAANGAWIEYANTMKWKRIAVKSVVYIGYISNVGD